jgi:hypothetical protein
VNSAKQSLIEHKHSTDLIEKDKLMCEVVLSYCRRGREERRSMKALLEFAKLTSRGQYVAFTVSHTARRDCWKLCNACLSHNCTSESGCLSRPHIDLTVLSKMTHTGDGSRLSRRKVSLSN